MHKTIAQVYTAACPHLLKGFIETLFGDASGRMLFLGGLGGRVIEMVIEMVIEIILGGCLW